MKVFGVTGYKNAGKTELVTRLVAHFAGQGLRVSTLKNSHHAVDLEVTGTDTDRHRKAGAHEVMLASGARYALMQELPAPLPMTALLARFASVDLVLIEGFKTEAHPKIEVHRASLGHDWIYPDNASIAAIASDQSAPCDLPQFHLDDIAEMAEFILSHAVPLESLPTCP